MRSRSSGLPVPENAVLDQSSSLLFSFQGRCPCEGKSTYQVLILRSVPLPDCRPLLMGLCLQFLFVSAFGQAGPNPGGGLECSVSAPVGQPGIENEWSRRARPIPCAQPDAIDLRPDLRIGSNFATFGDDGAETIPALPQRLPNITGIEGGERRTGHGGCECPVQSRAGRGARDAVLGQKPGHHHDGRGAFALDRTSVEDHFPNLSFPFIHEVFVLTSSHPPLLVC